MISLFLKQVLDEQPANILQFAGSFFDRPALKDTVTRAMGQNKTNGASS